MSNETVRLRCSVPMSLAQLVRLRTRLGWSCHTPWWTNRPRSRVFTSYLKRRGRHRTLVADLADDLSHICGFAGRDASLLDNKEELNHNCSLFVGQAGDLGCFKCPSCAKPYISTIWFQKLQCKLIVQRLVVSRGCWAVYFTCIGGVAADSEYTNTAESDTDTDTENYSNIIPTLSLTLFYVGSRKKATSIYIVA